MSIKFGYELIGAGWSECTLVVDDARVTITASYLSDALRSLISAICRVLAGIDESTATFDEEPGEFRWRLFRIDREVVRVVILEFDDLWSGKPDSAGKPIFDVQVRLRTFAGAVYDGCKQLLAEHGRAGYKEKWREHDFPDCEFKELRNLLDGQPKTVRIRIQVIENRYGRDNLDNAGDDLVHCLHTVSDYPGQYSYTFQHDRSHPNPYYHTLNLVVASMDDDTLSKLTDRIRALGLID